MHGMVWIYQSDSIGHSSVVAAKAMQKDVIDKVDIQCIWL
jgi:hypothetical protein